jgi:hypothetical protein
MERIKLGGVPRDGVCFSIFLRAIGWDGTCRARAPQVYLQFSSFSSIAIDIQPTSAGKRRGEQMKSEDWLQYAR